MNYLNKDDYFYKEMNDQRWIIFNPEQNIPMKIGPKKKLLFDFLIQHNYDLEKCATQVSQPVLEQLKELFSILKKQKFIYRNPEGVKKAERNELRKDSCKIYIHLTDRCNLKCTYCYNEFFRGAQKELSLVHFKEIVDKVIYHTNSITLTGGEPFLHRDICEMIRYIRSKKKKLYLDIITNGVLDMEKKLNGNVAVLKMLDGIKLSCDKLHGDQEERIGFNSEKFKKNVQFLIKNYPPEQIEISSVFSKGLEDDVLEVKAYSGGNCIKHTTVIRIPTELTKEETEKVPMPDDFLKLSAQLNTDLESSTKKKRKVSLQRTPTCGAAYSVFSVDVGGNVFPCQSFHFPEIKLGNILDADMKQIFLSETATKVRNHDTNNTDGCNSCKLNQVCGSGCKADTYKLHGSMSHFPEFMHPYYKRAAIDKLEHITYESPSV